MQWWNYVEQVTGRESQSEIARRIRLTSASVSRWKSSAPKPENVVAFAKAYKRPVLEAFVAAGFLTKEEANQRPSAPASVAQLTNEELAAEVSRRLLAQPRERHLRIAGDPGQPDVGMDEIGDEP